MKDKGGANWSGWAKPSASNADHTKPESVQRIVLYKIAVTVVCLVQTWLDMNKPVMLHHCLGGWPRKSMASAEKLPS